MQIVSTCHVKDRYAYEGALREEISRVPSSHQDMIRGYAELSK